MHKLESGLMNPVELFEDEFRKYVGSGYAAAVCNGTAALHSALLACKMQARWRVITTPFTFPATVNAILYCGGIPVFADIDPDTYCIDAYEVERLAKTDYRIRAVIAVDLFGNTPQLDYLREFCDEERIVLVEDASQALGAKYKDKMAGTWGDVGTFSFYATKNLWTYEGGMVVTDNELIDRNVRMIRNHGLNEEGQMVALGYNYKMPWNCAFQGWQQLLLHKPAIEAELGRYGPWDGYYPQLVYDHPYYKRKNIFGDCPVAEGVARDVKELMME